MLGFRRFMLRGLAKVKLEWTLVCAAYNRKRLHRLGADCKRAVAGRKVPAQAPPKEKVPPGRGKHRTHRGAD